MSHSTKTTIITVRCRVPTRALQHQIRDYVADALVSWGGSLQPPGEDGSGVYNPDELGDPMFPGIRVKRVKVTQVKQRKKRK